jgi:hypothetical protein
MYISDAVSCLIKVLCEFSPLHAIFSTPNYEANKAIRAAVNSADAVGDGDRLTGHTPSSRYL